MRKLQAVFDNGTVNLSVVIPALSSNDQSIITEILHILLYLEKVITVADLQKIYSSINKDNREISILIECILLTKQQKYDKIKVHIGQLTTEQVNASTIIFIASMFRSGQIAASQEIFKITEIGKKNSACNTLQQLLCCIDRQRAMKQLPRLITLHI